jgi:phosphate transport system permease protein
MSNTATYTELSEETRAEIRRVSDAKRQGRLVRSSIMKVLAPLALLFAAVPLISLLVNLISKGGRYLAHWSFYSQVPSSPSLFSESSIGGVSTAITGSLLIVLCAAVLSVPIGVTAGVYLAENETRLAKVLRVIASTMSGAPSVLMGLFAIGFLVVTLKIQASAFDGAVALAILMLPVITIATEIAVRNVPSTYREAGLALGAKKARVSMKVIIPAARSAIMSAILLAIARAVGETAPIVFVIGGVAKTTLNPFNPVQALPALLYSDIGSPYPALRDEAWGIGLLLVLFVFVLSFTARLWSARAARKFS